MITLAVGISNYLMLKEGAYWQGAGIALLIAMIFDLMWMGIWAANRRSKK